MGRQGKATRYRHKTCSCLCLPTALPPCRQSPVKRSLLLVDDVLHFLTSFSIGFLSLFKGRIP